MIRYFVVALGSFALLLSALAYYSNVQRGALAPTVSATRTLQLAARYPIRARTPDFFSRAKGRYAGKGIYRS